MYGYPYNSFNGYQNQFNQIRQEIVKVNGENGARAYQLAPNSQMLVLDESNPIVYLLQTDGAGYKTVTGYTIAPIVPETPRDIRTLEERIRRLEERYESNFATVDTKEQHLQQNQPATRNSQRKSKSDAQSDDAE